MSDFGDQRKPCRVCLGIIKAPFKKYPEQHSDVGGIFLNEAFVLQPFHF